ncbi:MAG: nucleotide sugar dehydrogenase [Actinomycetota bacterium]
MDRSAAIGVLGQGYVGLTVACAAADAGFPVTGIDIDEARIEDLRRGTLSVPGVLEEDFRSALATGRLSFSSSSDDLEGCDIALICVPTPLRDHAPDLSFVERACLDVVRYLSTVHLVLLESTTYPGTTDDVVRPLFEAGGFIAGRDFLLAYSPERIDPGNLDFGFRSIPRIVGGVTPEATGAASLFYEQLVDKVVAVSSPRAAELAKLLENTFRHVNVALVNEMAMFCHEMGIDVWEVIEAAATKPFGFMQFSPGPGVGGHCIPLDPAYLAWQVRRDAGHQFRILEQAQDVNAQMPGYVATRIGEALNDAGKPVKGARVLVLGVAYKPDVGDIRESPSIGVMTMLARRGAQINFHDPYVEAAAVSGTVLARTELSHRAVSTADCVILLTPHRLYDLEWIADHAQLVFDARNAYGQEQRPNVIRL